MIYTDLALKNISYKYEETVIFENISFSLPLRGLLQVKGKNGAGKTTLINLIIGLLQPDSGEISFKISRSKIGYAPQEPLLLEGLTIGQNLQAMSALRLN